MNRVLSLETSGALLAGKDGRAYYAKYYTNIGDGVHNVITVTPTFSTYIVAAQVFKVSTGKLLEVGGTDPECPASIVVNADYTVTITFDAGHIPAASAMRVVIIGG